MHAKPMATASPARSGIIKIGIAILTLITAAVHLVFLNVSLGTIDPTFTLNGIGYLTLLVLYFLPQLQARHSLIRWVYMGFAAVTILAWIALGVKTWPGGALGYITKLVEIGLIVLLWIGG
jgi:hypothetical protein